MDTSINAVITHIATSRYLPFYAIHTINAVK